MFFEAIQDNYIQGQIATILILSTFTNLKGKYLWGTIIPISFILSLEFGTITIGGLPLVFTSIRLAKPDSWWAKNYYDELKLSESKERFSDTKAKESIKESSDTDDKLKNLKRLKELLDDEVLTQEEFESEKKKILNKEDIKSTNNNLNFSINSETSQYLKRGMLGAFIAIWLLFIYFIFSDDVSEGDLSYCKDIIAYAKSYKYSDQNEVTVNSVSYKVLVNALTNSEITDPDFKELMSLRGKLIDLGQVFYLRLENDFENELPYTKELCNKIIIESN